MDMLLYVSDVPPFSLQEPEFELESEPEPVPALNILFQPRPLHNPELDADVRSIESEQAALLAHGELKHSSTSTEHENPDQPSTQKQR